MARWSKLKKKVEEIFVPELGLQIHCNVFTTTSKHDTYHSPRTWLQCDKKILFDFPGMFLLWKNPEERSAVRYMEEDASTIGELIDEYLATPKAELLGKEFSRDRWGFTDFLKVADRRLGKDKLKHQFSGYPVRAPIGALLQKRISGTSITDLRTIESRHFDLEEAITGLPTTLRARTIALCDGYSNPKEVPAIRVLSQRRSGDVEVLFAIKISGPPVVIEEHAKWFEYEYFKKDELKQISDWILLNQDSLLDFWKSGADLNPEQLRTWASGLVRSTEVSQANG